MLESTLPAAPSRGKPACVNLRERFGRDFKIGHEESYLAERGELRADEEIILQIIPGRRGHVFPWGPNRLAGSTDTRGPTARRLAALPNVRIEQDGSDGVTVSFPPELLPQVADLLHLKRRRRLSPEARLRLAEAGAKTRFKHGTGAHCETRPCVGTG